jgi:hypothetical protein
VERRSIHHRLEEAERKEIAVAPLVTHVMRLVAAT